MMVYRITRSQYTKLDGQGAKLAGGRWNSRGIPLVYSGQSISLCVLEVAVHLPLGMLPADYVLTSIEVPEAVSMVVIPAMRLPLNWRVTLHAFETQNIGDDFFEKKQFCVLKVPSATVPTEHNFIINPEHPEFSLIKTIDISPYDFDSRLFIRK